MDTNAEGEQACPPPEGISFSPKKREPNSFMDLLKEREAEQKTVQLDISNHVPVHMGSPVVKGTLSAHACQVPHMCAYCWINDHMYCKNMKKNEHDIKPHGECLHFRYALKCSVLCCLETGFYRYYSIRSVR